MTAQPVKSKKRTENDLWLILGVSMAAFGLFALFRGSLYTFAADGGYPLLVRLLVMASLQFGIAGLGICIVAAWRGERFTAYGLRRQGLVKSVLLSALCFLPHILYSLLTHEEVSYSPFQMVTLTREVLDSPLLISGLGLLLIALVWGFFEGFNYAVISQKINQLYPSSSVWLNWGAIACAVICILIHGAVGVDVSGILEMLTIFFIIYGLILVRDLTGNAWGLVLAFIFLWNAY